VIGGALITNDQELDAAFGFLQNGAGAVPGPFDAFLTLRGTKTLALRMDRHCDNAETIAEFLTRHPAISQVIYPGLAEHPGHAIADKQMKRFGGMISVRLAGGPDAARDFCSRTKIFTLAESLGGVESLIEHPAAMTHASTEGSDLEVPADLVRLSVGIEDISDLLTDVERALAG
jgi:cystathionine gamma-synthase